jgi:glycerate 2-kinase
MTARERAIDIWQAGVDAVRPEPLVAKAVTDLLPILAGAPRILVVGAGKASGAMAAGLEAALGELVGKVEGTVNVPEGTTARTSRIVLHAARPQGSNQPTAAGVIGAQAMLELFALAGPDDVAICLISGGGSALMPCPVDGISLAAKQQITQLLSASGATIQEMNCVRKHLSRIKGGRLVEAFCGARMISLIISDVIGDPLDVIASGPTAPDPTTFGEALGVLRRYQLVNVVPPGIVSHLKRGARREIPETPKVMPEWVENRLIGTNDVALYALLDRVKFYGYDIIGLVSDVVGETVEVARTHAKSVRTMTPKTCLLTGGETTVTLGANPGLGGRNQEYVLAMLVALGEAGMQGVTILSGGTDGEDGPTDAAGALADVDMLHSHAGDYLARHDAYHYFEPLGGLLKTGLTGTNVMDLRVILRD